MIIVHRIDTILYEALVASDPQPSEHLGAEAVNAAITQTILALGTQGCTARMAQEFGDHPDVAATRMRWARSTPLIACSGAGHERPARRDPDADLTRAPRQPYPQRLRRGPRQRPYPSAVATPCAPPPPPRKRRTTAHAAGQR
jgi:hypothetical protein